MAGGYTTVVLLEDGPRYWSALDREEGASKICSSSGSSDSRAGSPSVACTTSDEWTEGAVRSAGRDQVVVGSGPTTGARPFDWVYAELLGGGGGTLG